MFKEEQKVRDARTAAHAADVRLYQATLPRIAKGEQLTGDEQTAFSECRKRLGISDAETKTDLAAVAHDANLAKQLAELEPLLPARQASERRALGECARIEQQLRTARTALDVAAVQRAEITNLRLQKQRAKSASARAFADPETLLRHRGATANY